MTRNQLKQIIREEYRKIKNKKLNENKTLIKEDAVLLAGLMAMALPAIGVIGAALNSDSAQKIKDKAINYLKSKKLLTPPAEEIIRSADPTTLKTAADSVKNVKNIKQPVAQGSAQPTGTTGQAAGATGQTVTKEQIRRMVKEELFKNKYGRK